MGAGKELRCQIQWPGRVSLRTAGRDQEVGVGSSNFSSASRGMGLLRCVCACGKGALQAEMAAGTNFVLCKYEVVEANNLLDSLTNRTGHLEDHSVRERSAQSFQLIEV